MFLPRRRVRLAAFLLDLAIPAATLGLLVVLGSISGLPPPTTFRQALVFALVALVAAAILSSLASWLTGGQSIGKGLLGLEVRRAGQASWDGRLRTLAWAFGRSTLGYVLVDCFGSGAVGAAFGRHRRAAHDIAFGSQVVAVDPSLFAEATTRRQLVVLRARMFDSRRQAGLSAYRSEHGFAARTIGFANKVVAGTTVAYVTMLKLAGSASSAPASAAAVSPTGSGAIGGSGVAVAAPTGVAGQVGLVAGGTALAVATVAGVAPADSYGDLPADGRVALFLASEGIETAPEGAVTAWTSTEGNIRLEPALDLAGPRVRQARPRVPAAVRFSVDGASPEDGTTRALVGEAPADLPEGGEDRTAIVVATTSGAPFGGMGVGWGDEDFPVDDDFPSCSSGPEYCRSFLTGLVYDNCPQDQPGVSTNLGNIGTFCGGQAREQLLLDEEGERTVPLVVASRVMDGELTILEGGVDRRTVSYEFDTVAEAFWLGGWPVDTGYGGDFDVHAAVVYDRALGDSELATAVRALRRLATADAR